MSCRFLAAATVVAGLTLATAPAIAQPPPPSGPPVLGETPVLVDTMVAGIDSRLGDAAGYAYTIAHNGQVVAEDGAGQARRAVDGTRAFTPTTRLEVMSVTKNMTAIALLKLLQAEGVSVDFADRQVAAPSVAEGGRLQAGEPHPDHVPPPADAYLRHHPSDRGRAAGIGTREQLVGPASARSARRDAQSSAGQIQERQLRR